MAPGFFSNIPVLSSLPSPLNLFNGDDTSSGADSPSGQSSSSPQAGPSKPTPILESGGERTSQTRKPSNTSIVIAESDTADSDTCRTGLSSDLKGRPRGLSSVSAFSGATGDSIGRTNRRKTRVETFVLVKPPPTTAKNPLNLQVQLVIPEKRTRNRRGSEAVSRAVQSNGEQSSVPSTPQRQSYEMEDIVQQSPNGPAGADVAVALAAVSTGKVPEKAPTDKAAKTAAEKTPKASAEKSSAVKSIPAEKSAEGPTGGVKRSNSVSSEGSLAASAVSGVSNTSTSGKRIVPLYNLAVHNVVQPTIVTDAGTDSRVARRYLNTQFSKRQLDIAGVGILEPAEIWLPYAGHVAGSPRPSMDPQLRGRPASMISTSSLTPASSRIEDPKLRSTVDLSVVAPQEDGAKKFFNKIFRKRGNQDPLAEGQRLKTPTRNTLGPGSRSSLFLEPEHTSLQVLSAIPGSPQLSTHQVHFPGEQAAVSGAQLGHPTFGLSPSIFTRRQSEAALDQSGAIVGLAADQMPDQANNTTVSLLRSGRPVGYTWTVRRWAKKNTDGWAAHIVAAAAAGLDIAGGSLPGEMEDDVVFEWVKLRVSPNGPSSEAVLKNHIVGDQIDLCRKGRVPLSATSTRSPAGSRTNLNRRPTMDNDVPPVPPIPAAAAKSKIFRRTSLALRSNSKDMPPEIFLVDGERKKPASSTRSGSPGSVDDEGRRTQASSVFDEGYDSDPEDSETPWQCSVWVKCTGQRQLIATLTPAPHHPKVIGVLRIPSGVRSIALTDLGSKQPAETPSVMPSASTTRSVTPSRSATAPARSDGLFTPATSTARVATPNAASRIREEVALTEENIKDIVSVTAMWLVAREEFGGLGARGRSKR